MLVPLQSPASLVPLLFEYSPAPSPEIQPHPDRGRGIGS
jgi:hypothetical protein